MSANPITSFDFEGRPLRSIQRDGEPWFVLADVCRTLEIKNAAQAAERLDDDEKGIYISYTLGGPQEVIIISEPGLYSLILRSQGATRPGTLAYRFRKFVTAELLPALRKDGRYETRPEQAGRSAQSIVAMQNQALALTSKLQNMRHPEERRLAHQMLELLCAQLGLTAPPLAKLGKDAFGETDRLSTFWGAIDRVRASGIELNHSVRPELLALNMTEVRARFREAGIRIKIDRELFQALKHSTSPKYVDSKPVKSAILDKTVACWVFRWDS